MLDALDVSDRFPDRVCFEICLRMKKETRQAWREFAYYSSLGFQIALSIFIGLFAGIYLDRRFGFTPWLTLIGLGMGIVAGYRNIGLAIKKSRRL